MSLEKKMSMVLVILFLCSFALWQNRQKSRKIEKRAERRIVPVSPTAETPSAPEDGKHPVAYDTEEAEPRQRLGMPLEKHPHAAHQGLQEGEAAGYRDYVAQKGDNLWNIVRRFYEVKADKTDAEVNRIVRIVKQASDLPNPDQLKLGEIVRLPVLPNSRFDRIPPGPEKKQERSRDMDDPMTSFASIPHLQKFTQHRVSEGQTLRKIAKQYYNDETLWYQIYDANKTTIKDPHQIPSGIYLKIPRSLDRGDN